MRYVGSELQRIAEAAGETEAWRWLLALEAIREAEQRYRALHPAYLQCLISLSDFRVLEASGGKVTPPRPTSVLGHLEVMNLRSQWDETRSALVAARADAFAHMGTSFSVISVLLGILALVLAR